jgi:alpha-L-fucosidase 2
MSRSKIIFFLFSLVIITSCQPEQPYESDVNQHMRLWYTSPAREWTDALPVGNGRLGAMVFGRTGVERIQFNEESLWGGTRINPNNPESLNHLDEIRRLLFNGENERAGLLANKYLKATPHRIRSHQTAGDLEIHFHYPDPYEILKYQRSLFLPTGIARTEYTAGNNTITREVFVSAPDDVIVIHLKSSEKGGLNIGLHFTRERDASWHAEGNRLFLTGQIIDTLDAERGPGGENMIFEARASIAGHDGDVSAQGDHLHLDGASEATVFLTAATDYNLSKLNWDRSIDPGKTCDEILGKAAAKGYDKIKKDHIAEHSKLFNRMELMLEELTEDTIPTDKRLQKVINGGYDAHLITLYFQYGRYLLMNSSRSPGILPANLQGVWNEHTRAPWNADYHVNINLQMNYWPAEVCNLHETAEPLIQFIDRNREPGRVTARDMYGTNGWTMHHITNIFGFTALADAIHWGMFPMGASWMCLPIWRHFEYTMDTTYLGEVGYPIMKEAAEFVRDFLIESPDGYLVTSPSYSPENSFIDPKTGGPMRLTYAATMDIQIIRELFNACRQAAMILETDHEFVHQLETTLTLLPPARIGRNGTIMEWIKDYEEHEPGHRHMSHLLALHPGSQITPDTPELFGAARKTIERRLAHGGGHTGWSRAWIINMYARLLDGEEAFGHLQALLGKSTLPNLFDTHPPFQIDGNFGGTAGIAEMLLQSHNGLIHILPSLPGKWKSGSIKGIKARGNFELNIYWENNDLTQLELIALKGGTANLKYRDQYTSIKTTAGETYILDKNLNP